VSGLTGWITDVNVRVNLDYPSSGDLRLVLHAPNGRTVDLAVGNGDGNFFLGAIFDDQAPQSINVQDPHGPFYHVQPFDNLSILNGIKSEILNGTWQLEVRGAGTSGILKSWSLDIQTSLFTDNLVLNNNASSIAVVFDRDINAATFTSADIARMVGPAGVITGTFSVAPMPGAPASMAKRAFLIGFPTQALSGTYQVTVGPDIEVAVETQLITIPITVTSVRFSFNGVLTSTPLAYTGATTAAQVLANLSTIAALAGKINVTGGNGGPYTVSFPGFADVQVALIGVSTFTGGTVSPTVLETTARLDTDLDVGVDILRGGDPTTGPLTAKTYANPLSTSPSSPPNSPGLGIVIPANSTITALLPITDQFKIVQGPAFDFNRHIQVFVDIVHSQDPDLEAVLIAPDGTEIRLFSNVGVNQRVTFDDFVSSPPPATGQVFQVATANPQIALSRLQGKFTSGTWQLRVSNNGFIPGTLRGFSIRAPFHQSGSGLGEPVADSFTTGFRIFTMDASNPLSDSVWTAVGPAASNQYGSAGRVTAMAVDPSDSSGNTVYIGSANGGVWKTSNFLTTNPQGPTYVPLTDLGPSNSLNINHIAIQPRNNDPRQSIIFVGTGDTDTNAPGIGLLRSMDGGASWQIIDSRDQNFDANGNALPISSASRDHLFVGTRVNKIVIDPTPLPNAPNEYAVYMAVGGGGIEGVYRSLDTGRTWTLLRAGNATDVTLAPGSGGPSSNELLTLLYAAIEDVGLFYTTSATSALTLIPMAGGVGKVDHRDGANRVLGVNAPVSTPSGNNRGRILIATPYKTGDRLADIFLQNWVYAMVIDSSGLSFDLYMTKDRGDNWTRVVIPVSGLNGGGVPTNDENIGVSSSIRDLYPSFPSIGGDYAVAMTIDPSNPNIVYLAGDVVIKVDVTTIRDPWAVITGDHSDNVAGAANGPTLGSTNPGVAMFDGGIPATPDVPDPRDDHINMYRDPYNPFQTPSTFTYQAPLPPSPVAFWINDGTDVSWAYFDVIHDVFSTSNRPPFRTHELVAVKDQLTGKTRLLVGNDQGVFTAVDRGDATVHTGIGSADSVRGSRNGNLQIAQMLSGAVQPSTLAADVSGSLFYGMALNNGIPASSADIINTGNLNWQTYDETGFNDLLATAVDGNGSWIMTDATGGFDRIENGVVIFDPNRIGTTYQYRWPCCNNQVNLGFNDFFIIDFPTTTPISRGTGLAQSTWPLGSFNLFTNGTPRPFGRFAVNPLTPEALLISSQAGRVYRSSGADGFGIRWNPIAEPAVLDGTAAQALAFGSPATSVFNLNDFIYAGTDGGDVFVTRDGGGTWRNISTGLDGGTVLSIIPNPRRGSNEAYAITGMGVYWMADSSLAAPTWVKLNDTPGRDSLFNFNRPLFNNPNDLQPIMLAGQITSMSIDWRYQIPDDPNNPSGPKHPVLYIAGNAGVFRSIDKGLTYNLYPDLANNQAPQEGGYLPNVYVTDLDIMLGYLNPATGATNHAASHNILMATTYGRGAFAIRLDDTGFSQFLVDATKGPKVIDVDQVSPNPGNVLSGFEVTFDSLVDIISFTPADVQVFAPNNQPIAVQSVIEITTVPPGGLNPHNRFRITFAEQSAPGNYRLIIGPNVSDFGGNLMNQDDDSTNGENPVDRFESLFFFTPNTPPTISNIANQSVLPNTTIDIGFSIGDGQTPATDLTLSATVSDPSLIVNLTFNGFPNPSPAVSTSPTVNITVGGTIGVATVTITVTDPFGLSASDTFDVAVNNPPSLLPDPLPNFEDFHGVFPVDNHVTLSGTDPDGDVVTFGGKAYTNASFTVELPGYVQVDTNTGEVDLTPAPSFVGTYVVRVFSTDTKAQTFGSFTVTVNNNPPSLAPIGDIVAHHRQFPMAVMLNGSDPDPGEDLTYSAKAYDPATHKIYQLSQSLRLVPLRANFSFNKFKRREKHFVSLANGARYFILPNGQLFLFAGVRRRRLRGIFVDQLPPVFWAVPSLLMNAPPPTQFPSFVSVSGDQLTLSPGGFIGTFLVEATVTDGAASASQLYKVTVVNTPPVFNSLIGSVTAPNSQFPQVRTLVGGDADGLDAPLLSYSAVAYEAVSYRARQLDNQFGLFKKGSYNFNKYRRKEKHFKGAGNKNFFILPDGSLFQRIGPPTSKRLRGAFIATLTPDYWLNPALLWSSPTPTVLAGFVSVNGDQIEFTPSPGFIGTYFVDAMVSDGAAIATQSIQVNVQ
jgi:subtilisin-like proprotein convertase family protein